MLGRERKRDLHLGAGCLENVDDGFSRGNKVRGCDEGGNKKGDRGEEAKSVLYPN